MRLRPGTRKPASRTLRLRARPRAEALEGRLAPAVQLTYGGPGTVLVLQELASQATPSVTISEPAPNQIRIDLGSGTFDGTSTTKATGLTYENPISPAFSNFATLDIGQPNDITTLRATLTGDTLTLGAIADASGGLGNVAAAAGAIVVTGLDTSHAAAGNGNVDLRAVGTLTVAQGAVLDTGTGTLALAAGVNADGTPAGAGGPVTVQDAGFETPSFGSGSKAYGYNPTGTPWTFTGTAGISGNNSGFTADNPDAPEGSQVAFLQEKGSISQSFDFAEGSYTLSFQAAERSGETGFQTIQLEVNGLPVGAPLRPAGTSYQGLTTASFWVPAGSHVISLDGVDPVSGDNTAFVNAISVAPASNLLSIDAGATVISENTGADAITLRGDNVQVNTSNNPAFVGAKPIVGGPPRATLTGVQDPAAMAFDAQGNLYVAEPTQAAVQVFAPGSTTPTLTLTGLQSPDALALDTHGNLFVADEVANAVYMFSPGATKPTATLTGLNAPSALAFDAHGNLFVANAGYINPGTTVSMFAPGSTTPTATLTGLSVPSALAFDAAGNLYVANTLAVDANPVSVFAPGATSPTRAPQRADRGHLPGLRHRRHPVRGRQAGRHGERVPAGSREPQHHDHRAESAQRPGDRRPRQPLRGQQRALDPGHDRERVRARHDHRHRHHLRAEYPLGPGLRRRRQPLRGRHVNGARVRPAARGRRGRRPHGGPGPVDHPGQRPRLWVWARACPERRRAGPYLHHFRRDADLRRLGPDGQHHLRRRQHHPPGQRRHARVADRPGCDRPGDSHLPGGPGCRHRRHPPQCRHRRHPRRRRRPGELHALDLGAGHPRHPRRHRHERQPRDIPLRDHAGRGDHRRRARTDGRGLPGQRDQSDPGQHPHRRRTAQRQRGQRFDGHPQRSRGHRDGLDRPGGRYHADDRRRGGAGIPRPGRGRDYPGLLQH